MTLSLTVGGSLLAVALAPSGSSVAAAATVTPAPRLTCPAYATDVSTGRRFTVRWAPSSALTSESPISYTAQYHPGAAGNWRVLLENTTATAVAFSGPPGTYFFRVHAHGADGTDGPWSAPGRTTVPIDQGSARFRGRWATVRGRLLYRGQARVSSARGASATLGFAAARSVALLVTKRPTGGIADVYIGARLLARVDTYARRVRYRVIVPIRNYNTPTWGTVRVVPAGSKRRVSRGKGVEIDGFAIRSGTRPVFGIDSNLGSLDPGPRERAMSMLESAGSRWIRVGMFWPWIDRNVTGPGQAASRDWSVSDAYVASAKSHQQTIVGGLLGYAAWANGRTDPSRPYYVPPDPSAFAQFAKDAVNRYKNDVRYWEVWNEPNGPFWTASDGRSSQSAAGYAALLRATYLAIKEADPDAVVIFGGLYGNHLSYLRSSYVRLRSYPDASANHNFFDILGAHPYCDSRSPTSTRGSVSSSRDRNFTGLVKLKAIMTANGDRKKHVIITEMSWSINDIAGYTRGVTPQTQARYLVQAYRMVQSWPWVDAMLWYGFANWDPADYEWNFSLIDQDFSRRPAFGAYAAEANR